MSDSSFMDDDITNIETLIKKLEFNHRGPINNSFFDTNELSENEKILYKEQQFKDFGTIIEDK